LPYLYVCINYVCINAKARLIISRGMVWVMKSFNEDSPSISTCHVARCRYSSRAKRVVAI